MHNTVYVFQIIHKKEILTDFNLTDFSGISRLAGTLEESVEAGASTSITARRTITRVRGCNRESNHQHVRALVLKMGLV